MADSTLSFGLAWLPVNADSQRERATFASLTIIAGTERVPVTEVDDVIAQTVRRDIRVPSFPLAEWLIVNWWRLRWEPRVDKISSSWLRAHSLSAVSPDVPWPALHFTSDGAFVHLEARAERIRDVAAVRYLRDVDLVIPVDDFERAVDSFLAQLDARIASCVPGDNELSNLIGELREERTDPLMARACRLQALAGFDPGVAPLDWVHGATSLADAAGQSMGDEVVAAIPTLRLGLAGATAAVEAMKKSPTDVRLEAPASPPEGPAAELPWQRGRRMAALFRASRGRVDGPVSTAELGQWLDVRLPLPVSSALADRGLTGGYRNGATKGRTRVVVTTDRPDNQRFYLSRLIGAALGSSSDEHVLPVTNAATAFQKFERSFAQELLCPWDELDAYTDEHGTDDDGIATAAEHFIVSQHLVLSTLVNNGKLGRHRLPFG